MTDVVVVGAGPAGCAAAITLARLGRDVVVVDKATFPRDKCCGDGLTTAALRLLSELGLDPSCVPSWKEVKETDIVATDGRSVSLPMPRDGTQFAASARRTDLDGALVSLASSAGASMVLGDGFCGLRECDDALEVSLSSGRSMRGRYVIAADGAWSPVRKAVGLSDPGYLGDWQAGRQYFTDVGPLAEKLWVWFEQDMVPGYAWSFPLAGGAANVGYGVLRPLSGLRGQRIEFLDRPHIAAVLGPSARPASSWKAWPIPTRLPSTELAALGGRVLFAGDAARACDPMTGEGIAQALETGQQAAACIAAAGPYLPATASSRYKRQVRWGMSLDHRLASALSGVLAHRRGSAWALGLVDSSDWCRRNFARWMFENYPRAALATPHRWHRHMLRSPGAYRS